MKLSDFQKTTANISSVESLTALDRNSTKAGRQVNWRNMPIAVTAGARERDPFTQAARSIATDEDSDVEESRRDRRLYTALHKALDRAIAREEGDAEPEESNSEEAEILEDDDEAEMEAGDAADFRRVEDAVANFAKVVRRSAERAGTATREDSGRSYVADAAPIVCRYLQPGQSCSSAVTTVERQLYSRQKDDSCAGYWSGLVHYLAEMPPNARVKDCNPNTLAALIQKLHENLLN